MKEQSHNYKALCMTMVLLFSILSANAATYYSRATGNWNSNNTWSLSSGGGAAGAFPIAGDNVIIERGFTVTVTANATCATINFRGTAGHLVVNSTLTVSGAVTVDNPANSNAAWDISGTGTLSCASLAVGSTFYAPTNNNTSRTHTLTSTLNTLNITGNLSVYSNFANNNRIRNGYLYLESGTVTVGGTLSTTNVNGNNTSTISLVSGAEAGTLVLTGATPYSFSGTGSNTIEFNGTSSLVKYSYTGNESIYATTYTNLTLAGSGVKTIPTGVTVNGILLMDDTATASGTVPTYGTGSTIQYDGSAAQSTGTELPSTFNGSGGIIINNSSGVSLLSSVTITNTLTLSSGAFNVGTHILTLNGPAIAGTPANLTTTSSSGLVFGGSSTGIAIPSSVTDLNSLTINNANGVTMNSSITLASSGVLTLTDGILDAGTHTLNITNTNPTTAVISSATSFVNVTTGGMTRVLTANISSAGTNYLFPIGEGGLYKAINLVNVNTGAVGPVLRASVSATGAVNGDNTTIGPVDPRYWSLTNTNSGNFISAGIEIFESDLDNTKTIGMSSAISGTYTSIGGTAGASSIVSPTTLNPGPYFCIGKIWVDTYYSYQTGDWHSFSTWTSDPSGTLQIGSTIPGTNDKVVILTDRTVSLSSDVNVQGLVLVIDAGGILDLTDRQFTQTLNSLSGQGTLKLASANFPVSTTNTFVNSGGGTTEYDNTADFTFLSAQTTYNNLTINTSDYTATQLSNITLNGNLYIESGTFRINNNTATTKLNLTINGNTTVDEGASFTVGNGVTNTAIGGTGGTAPFLTYYLNFHTVIIKGDFTNNGTVKFTNLPYPLFTAFPPTVSGSTSGAASVYFMGESNNTLTCNGITTFYNLILDKGTDQTYKLTINSSGYSNFRLFGANSLTVDGSVTSDPSLRKALWIRTGTMVLKGMLIIPSLTEGTASNADYYIPSNGALQFDGVDVVMLSTADDYREINVAYSVSAPDDATIGLTRGGYSSLYVFGKLLMNNGYLSTRESGGIITSSVASGQIIVNGGTVDAKQFLSSTGSASYTQSGGLFLVRGRFQRTPAAYTSITNLTDVTVTTLNTSRTTNGISSGYGSFNLENAANIYNVSGGTIRIYDVCGVNAGEQEAFDVKSSVSNINVSGGTLEIIPTTGTTLADGANYNINTSAAVNDLIINRSGSTSIVGLSSALVVQDDFSLLSGAITANNNNLTIGGDFTIESGTTYTPGTNTTIFNGSADQLFTINLSSALSLYNLTLNKTAGINISLAGSQGTINVSGEFNLVAGTLNDAGKTINISGNVYNSGIHSGTGFIILNGTTAQTIGGAGVFQNITLNNTFTSAAPVSLTANMTVNGVLNLANDKLFSISTYNLKLNAAASILNWGSARYIQTSGNSGDGGLTKEYSTIDAFTFPLGVAAKYTPAIIGFTSAPTTFGSVTINPVNYEHPITTINGQSLTYYWHVKSSGFTGIPVYSVSHQFVYASSDVVGTETSYVPAVYDASVHLWYYGTTASINTTSNTISDWVTPTNSTNFLDADYTAGLATSFGNPRIYYSRQSGVWSTLSTWSLTSHTVTNAPTVAPGPNDIVIIGDNDSIYLFNEPALPTNNNNPAASFYSLNKATVSCANLQIEEGSVLDIQNNPGCTFATVSSHSNGNGKIRITTRNATFDNPSSFIYPSGDFSDFATNNGISEFYTINPQSGTYYILPSNANYYGTMILTPLRDLI